MQDLLTDFSAYLKRKRRYISTHHAILQHVEPLLLWLEQGRIPLSQVKLRHVTFYMKRMETDGSSGGALRPLYAHLRVFFRYCYQSKIIPNNFAKHITPRPRWQTDSAQSPDDIFKRHIRHAGTLAQCRRLPFSEDLAGYLATHQSVWHNNSYFQRIIRVILHFHQYIVRRGLPDLPRVSMAHIDDFLAERKYSTKEKLFARNRLRAFIAYYCRRRGVTSPFANPPLVAQSWLDRLINEHDRFCREHKGLRQASLKMYRYALAGLSPYFIQTGITRLEEINLGVLDGYLLHLSKSFSPKSMHSMIQPLRSFLKFLFLRDDITDNLGSKLLSPSRFKMNTRPKYIPWKRIQEFLAAFPRLFDSDKRDYALLILFTRYGLRAREVASLQLDDIDFEKGELILRERKDRRAARFPLLPEVSAALKDYLAIRPQCPCPELFILVKPTLQAMGCTHIQSAVIRRLVAHFGRSLPNKGAYLLRHSFAKAMLDQGARIDDVGTVLGHHSLRTTLIYTRIHTKELSEVADNYANLL